MVSEMVVNAPSRCVQELVNSITESVNLGLSQQDSIIRATAALGTNGYPDIARGEANFVALVSQMFTSIRLDHSRSLKKHARCDWDSAPAPDEGTFVGNTNPNHMCTAHDGEYTRRQLCTGKRVRVDDDGRAKDHAESMRVAEAAAKAELDEVLRMHALVLDEVARKTSRVKAELVEVKRLNAKGNGEVSRLATLVESNVHLNSVLMESIVGTHGMMVVCGGLSGGEISTRLKSFDWSFSCGGGTEGEIYRLKRGGSGNRLPDLAIKVYFVMPLVNVTENLASEQIAKDFMLHRRLGTPVDVVDIGSQIQNVRVKRGDVVSIRKIIRKVLVMHYSPFTGYDMQCFVHKIVPGKPIHMCGAETHRSGRPCQFGIHTRSSEHTLLFDNMCHWIESKQRWELSGLHALMGFIRSIEILHDMGYIHRDIKPGNLLILMDGMDKRVSMIPIDFGNAMAFEDPNTGWCHSAVFTMYDGYFPPEICYSTILAHSKSTAWPPHIQLIFANMASNSGANDLETFRTNVRALSDALLTLHDGVNQYKLQDTVKKVIVSVRTKLSEVAEADIDNTATVVERMKWVQDAVQMRCSAVSDTYAVIRIASVVINFMTSIINRWLDTESNRRGNTNSIRYRHAEFYICEWGCVLCIFISFLCHGSA